MSAMLKLTHKAIGAEVRRGTYDVVVDGERVGSVEMNHTIEIPAEPGRHTLAGPAMRSHTGWQGGHHGGIADVDLPLSARPVRVPSWMPRRTS